MPGTMVKNWKQYEALRREGYSKESAARITNASVRRQHKRRLKVKFAKRRHSGK